MKLDDCYVGQYVRGVRPSNIYVYELVKRSGDTWYGVPISAAALENVATYNKALPLVISIDRCEPDPDQFENWVADVRKEAGCQK